MNILLYNDLNTQSVKKVFDKVVKQLQNNDFAGAEVKKMQNTGYYRAKLDYENRLLFKFAKYNNQAYILLLEVILNHEYDKSRFLRGAEIDESKMQILAKPEAIPTDDFTPISFINPKQAGFHLLDKVLSLDDDQTSILHLPTPVIIIGSAGSGKTALTLEKIKQLRGNILYVTLSSFLVESATNIYYSHNYENSHQEVDFLSFKDYLQTLRIPNGHEITFQGFDGWFNRHRNAVKIRDSYKLFEEFRGVLTGNDINKPYLSKQDYLSLGVRQSVFLIEEREQVYSLFEKYLQFLQDNNYYDLNIIAHQWLQYLSPNYDFVIVDEVQDLTNIQLYLILKSLKNPSAFILCGDSNQIVHPNFFSWTNVKSLFYKTDVVGQDIHILKTNYRNSPEVTHLANTLLKIKHLRFGSIDRESTYLVNSISSKSGEVVYLEDTPKIKQDLNQKTKNSTQYAVLVMNNADKAEARKLFQTPLLFSIQEAKGLEYENIILVNFISQNATAFREICNGVAKSEIDETEELAYNRAKDKTDKSLDVYKFYVNSLYVAFTRSIRNLYIVENNKKHEMLQLLDLVNTRQQVDIKEQKSSLDDWKREAQKLEQQGKQEQADFIKQNILHIEKPNWTPIATTDIDELKKTALDENNFNKKAKDQLFEYALIYHDLESIKQLVQLKYRRAEKPENEYSSLYRKHYQAYKTDDIKALMPNLNKYGIDYRDIFNYTPLMAATQAGSLRIAQFLIENNANKNQIDNKGRNPLQINIAQAYTQPDYLKLKFGKLYGLLAAESIKIKVDNQLVKIDRHKAEFLLINVFIALQTEILIPKHKDKKGIQMDDLLSVMEPYPSYVLPDYRKKRSYISAMMSKNETGSTDKYSKKLFLRRQTGYYAINPNLEIMIGDDWINVYNLMQTPKLYKVPQLPAILKDMISFTGDKEYDMPISHLHKNGVLRNMFIHDVDAEIVNNNIELRTIKCRTSQGLQETNVLSVRCKMPENIGGGQVLVDISGIADWQNQYKHTTKTKVRFDLRFGNYAYAYIVE